MPPVAITLIACVSFAFPGPLATTPTPQSRLNSPDRENCWIRPPEPKPLPPSWA